MAERGPVLEQELGLLILNVSFSRNSVVGNIMLGHKRFDAMFLGVRGRPGILRILLNCLFCSGATFSNVWREGFLVFFESGINSVSPRKAGS